MSMGDPPNPFSSKPSDEFARGYRQGFQDGYKQAKDELQRTEPDRWWMNPPGCSVCGLTFTGPMGYVCPHPKCPSRAVAYSGILTESAASDDLKNR